MTTLAKAVIRLATDILVDATSVHWAANQLVRYLNAGQREIVLHRPDAITTTGTIALATGTRQTLPSGATKLLDVIRNTTGTKRSITHVDKALLDQTVPGWHGITGSSEIKHFDYDPLEPTAFYVYPPAASASVEARYAVMPTDVSEPADGSIWSDVSGNVSVPDIYVNPLLDYILYRAYSTDGEHQGDPARAVAHYTAFANALGIELKATAGIAPPVTSRRRGVQAAT